MPRPRLPASARTKHLLSAFFFLKAYDSEHVNSAFAQCDENNYRKWVWFFVGQLAHLDPIKWANRETGRINAVYKCSVDGVDFPIDEPAPFYPMWFSHKFKGAGLRYEVGIGIGTGNICWAFGPFSCRSYSDLKIYRMAMKYQLGDGKRVVADEGYKDESCSYSTEAYGNGEWGFARARHEAFNKRLKHFAVLGRQYRHNLRRHSDCVFRGCERHFYVSAAR